MPWHTHTGGDTDRRLETCRPDLSCPHESYEHLGTTTGDGRTLLRRGCEDCGERFTVEEPTDTGDCKCGHIWFRHQASTVNGSCSVPDCECMKYEQVKVEDVELPEERRCNGCGHHEGEGCGCSAHAFVSREHCDCCEGTWLIKAAADLPTPEGPEYRPCMACGHVELTHDRNEGHCTADPRCGCSEYRPLAEPEGCDHACDCGHAAEDHSSRGWCKQCDCERNIGHYADECLEREPPESQPFRAHCRRCNGTHEPYLACPEAPPQPDRRPPYAVAYSVSGHLYEVYVPGDASAVAVDGALVIKHTDPVAGIVQVQPVRTEK